MSSSVGSFFEELRRRKVVRVAIVYAAASFVVWQVADIAFPYLSLPDTAVTLVLALTILGFPVALVLAWAYELKPEEPAVAQPGRGCRERRIGRRPAASGAGHGRVGHGARRIVDRRARVAGG